MKITELKAMIPSAQVYALNTESRYLIVVDQFVDQFTCKNICDHFPDAAVVRVRNPESALRVFEVMEK